MLLLLSVLPAWSAPCDNARLDSAYTRVQTAYVQADLRGTRKAVRSFTEAATCGPPSAAVVHDLHVAHALEALMANKRDDADQHLRVAVAANPASALPSTLATDARVRQAYHVAQEAPITWKRSAPYVFDNRTWTVAPDVDRSPPVPVRNTARSAATALGAVAAGLYVSAWAARSTYDRTKGPQAARSDVVPLHRATNVLAVSSAAVGGVAIGLFSVSLVR